MKEIRVVATCDKCGGSDADEYTELNSRGKPVILDLDKPCRDEFEELRRQAALILAPIAELADAKGVKLDKPGKPMPRQLAAATREGTRICLLCPETRNSDATLRSHFIDDHGLSGSFVEAYGQECPLDGLPFEKIGHHVRQAHKDLNLPHYSHVFHYAQQHGDPKGVVANQIAALQKLAKAS